MEHDFKVGDKVRRVSGAHNGMQPGCVGTVSEVMPDGIHVSLKEYIGLGGHSTRNLEIVLPPTTAKDPNGIDQHAPGAKLDAGKLMAGQILSQFPRALEAIASVGTFGARKYTLGGWLEVPNAQARYSDAEHRHWLARSKGETLDPESNMPHSWHKAWNVLAQLELELREAEKKN